MSNMNQNDAIHFEALYPEDTRERQVKQVLEFVKRGNSCQIVGLPGVGRSNIFALLAYNRKVRIRYLGENHKWFHFVYMDFSEVKKRPLPDVIKFILISLADSLSERHFTQEQAKIKEFLKEGLSFQDELVLFLSLKKSIDYLSIEKELTVVFLCDRFDSYLPSLTPDFFTNLKILRNRAKYRFSAVFSLPRPFEDMLEATFYSEFYEFLIENIIYLPLYDKSLTDFRFSYLEKVAGKKESQAIKDAILKLSGGHGKLSRVCYEAVLGEDKAPKNPQEFLLSKSQVKGVLYEIWLSLLPEEQHAIRTLAAGKTAVAIPSYLIKVGLVKENAIQIRLLPTFISSLPAAGEKITYSPETNEILKGKENLTDKLSPLEFRLLRYLLQNEGKVVEKDEIITAVWRDTATQEGVTDQALDQIIYRLRKKIEDDPNSPHHIQTIKGRGYRFISD